VVEASVPISLVGLDKRGRLHFRAGHVTRWDITATDQIKPIATTTARPIPSRTCSPTSRDQFGSLLSGRDRAPIGCGFPERDWVCEAPLGLLAVRGFRLECQVNRTSGHKRDGDICIAAQEGTQRWVPACAERTECVPIQPELISP
jgi:hypothetical protein